MSFSKQIEKFEKSGEYNYKLDESGNVIANSSSAIFEYNYLALPLNNFVYDNKSIVSYYGTDFSEFFPTPKIEEIQQKQEYNAALDNTKKLEEENQNLKNQLNDLIKSSESNSNVAQNEATKQVILDLRISLGQGKEERDFSKEFPYTPKTS